MMFNSYSWDTSALGDFTHAGKSRRLREISARGGWLDQRRGHGRLQDEKWAPYPPPSNKESRILECCGWEFWIKDR